MGLSKKDKKKLEELIQTNKELRDALAAQGITIDNLEKLYLMSDEAQDALLRAHYAALTEGGIIIVPPTTPPTVPPVEPPTEPPTEPPVEPPVEPPTTGGTKDQYGINKIYADKTGGVLIPSDKFSESEFTRNYASGKPSENSYECEYKDSNKLENEEVTFYCQINGFKSATDTMSVKLLGNKHSDGSKDKWLIYQLMTDGGNEDNFQIEDPHPTNHDNHQPTAFTIGETIVGKVVGFKAITFIAEDGKRHAETWLDFPTSLETPANKWRKYIDIKDVGSLSHGFVNATNGGALLRIDGTKKGDMPTTKFMSIREIVPVVGPTVPPVVEPPTPTGQCEDPNAHYEPNALKCVCNTGYHEDATGKCVPDVVVPPVEPPITGNVIYDSNTIGKWNTKPRTVTGMDPECPKVFTGGGGLEMHASGNPQLEIAGDGTATLVCQPGHGRFYVDVCNYNSTLEYEVNFLDGSVENQTMNLRSRHQEGDPPANRMGGIQAKLDLKNYDFKTEIYHNVHENSSGDKPLPKALSLNTWYKVRYTVKDVGTSLFQGMELDYGDGQGYVKVGEQTIKSPNKVYMEKDKILGRSYMWLRMNNSKSAKIAFRNVRLTAL